MLGGAGLGLAAAADADARRIGGGGGDGSGASGGAGARGLPAQRKTRSPLGLLHGSPSFEGSYSAAKAPRPGTAAGATGRATAKQPAGAERPHTAPARSPDTPLSVLEEALRLTPSPLDNAPPPRIYDPCDGTDPSRRLSGVLAAGTPGGEGGGAFAREPSSASDMPCTPTAEDVANAAAKGFGGNFGPPASATYSPVALDARPPRLDVVHFGKSPSCNGASPRVSAGSHTFGRSPSNGAGPFSPDADTPTWPPPDRQQFGAGGSSPGTNFVGGSAPIPCPEAPRPNKMLAARMRLASISRSSSLSGSRSFGSDSMDFFAAQAGPRELAPLTRQDSLTETKLLVTTRAKTLARSQSVFEYEDQFHSYQLIGKGSFSEVYRARHRLDGELYAVKRTIREFRNRSDRESYRHELDAVADLPLHPNVVTYFRGWQQGKHFWVQMEYVVYGSVKSVIERLAPMELPLLAAWGIVREVAAGLDFLHANNIMHLDIKPDNIFVDDHGIAKVGDFGLAVADSKWGWEDGDGGYLAPELLVLDHTLVKPTFAADVFSLGVIMYELACHKRLPRDRAERKAALEQALSTSTDLKLELLQLAARCLSCDPSARPTAAEIYAQCPPPKPGTRAEEQDERARAVLAEVQQAEEEVPLVEQVMQEQALLQRTQLQQQQHELRAADELPLHGSPMYTARPGKHVGSTARPPLSNKRQRMSFEMVDVSPVQRMSLDG